MIFSIKTNTCTVLQTKCTERDVLEEFQDTQGIFLVLLLQVLSWKLKFTYGNIQMSYNKVAFTINS